MHKGAEGDSAIDRLEQALAEPSAAAQP
jgi:hypothetical protein